MIDKSKKKLKVKKKMLIKSAKFYKYNEIFILCYSMLKIVEKITLINHKFNTLKPKH